MLQGCVAETVFGSSGGIAGMAGVLFAMGVILVKEGGKGFASDIVILIAVALALMA